MEITFIKDSTFRLKGKTGIALTDPMGLTLEPLDETNPKIFKTPGEYEVAGISVLGIKTDEGLPAQTGIVFVYEIDGLRICHLGNITKKLSDSKVSAIGDIDIVIVPVTTESIEMIQQLESYYIIPFGAKSEAELEKFLKESGLAVERLSKFSIRKDDLIEDSTAQIIVLNS